MYPSASCTGSGLLQVTDEHSGSDAPHPAFLWEADGCSRHREEPAEDARCTPGLSVAALQGCADHILSCNSLNL
jgi:hypothetical protein